IRPKNYGVIVRTSAEGKRVAELNNELKTLQQAFEDACAKAQKSEAPALVFEEENRVVGMLRDIFSPSFESIHVNDPDIYAQILKYVNLIAPERREIVKLYSRPEPIFDAFSITRQIKSSFGKTVSFKSGSYIIIEHTEALHVIDVNSGNRTKAGSDQETNALEVNLRAADEIARQLRLRDMGGIIVVDFIDMAKSEHRQQLYEHMREVMANDRARHNILPLSKFGLMQITRQRVRPVLDITVAETCPSCFGKGEIQPSLLFTDTLYEKLEYLVNTLGQRDFVMYVHPFVEAYIRKGLWNNLYRTWRRRLGRCFKILPDESLAYLQYRVFDADRKELKLHDDKDLSRSSASKTTNKALKRGSDDTPEDAAPRKPASQPKAEKKKPQSVSQPASESPEAKPSAQETPKNETPKPKKQKSKQAPRPKPEPEAAAADIASEPTGAEAPELKAEPAPAADMPAIIPAALLPEAEAESPAYIPCAEQAPSPETAAVASPLQPSPEPEADDDDDGSDEDSAETADADSADTPARKRRRRRRRAKNRRTDAETEQNQTPPEAEKTGNSESQE
ncbi:MAG: ribonuclease E/G, partial [Muribaculaceae bacterium]|nr:ribonuclease E/G [Muribaculaceae bacterium]